MADKYYYNGVLLPEIPADVLAEYPYAWIRLSGDGTKYQLFVSPSKWFLVDENTGLQGATPQWYDASAESDSFELFTEYSNTRNVGLAGGLIWSNHDIPKGSAASTVIYFNGSEPVGPNTPDDDTQTEVYYRISGERLKGFANQVRRISGVEGELTPEQMETNLLNVTPLGEYPKAEESAFGASDVAVEYGVTNIGSTSNIAVSTYYYCFNKFTANEAFAIHGVRVYTGRAQSRLRLRLWDSSGTVIRETGEFNTTAGAWTEVYFDQPVSVAIGESFTVSTDSQRNATYIAKSSATFNSKITFNFGTNSEKDSLPTSGKSSLYGIGDIIIAPVQAEPPDDYQIQRTTMDDIAEEVQRITGATTKLTTAQIITGLSEVEVLEDYEEVAF